MKPFEFVNQILKTKNNLIIDEATEKEYKAFSVNRTLSYHYDCLPFASEMNRRHHLDSKLQNDYLLNTVRSKNRPFVKWAKSETSDDIECIKQIYQFSDSKAREALRLLSPEQIQQLKEQTDTGGLRK
jgi:hypothetical protein